jgi:hypothetical protein
MLYSKTVPLSHNERRSSDDLHTRSHTLTSRRLHDPRGLHIPPAPLESRAIWPALAAADDKDRPGTTRREIAHIGKPAHVVKRKTAQMEVGGKATRRRNCPNDYAPNLPQSSLSVNSTFGRWQWNSRVRHRCRCRCRRPHPNHIPNRG